MVWYRRLGRTVYVVYPFVLVGVLLLVGTYLTNFTVEQSGSNFSQHDTVVLHPNQTYIENVTISYENLPSDYWFSVRNENDSIVIVFPPFMNTAVNWTRVWLPFTIELNESTDAFINRSLVGPVGTVKSWAVISLAAGGGVEVGRTEVTQGGTSRLFIQNVGSQDMHLIITWQIEGHYYEKSYLYYGIAILLIVPFVVAIFLIRRFGPWKTRKQSDG